MLNIFFFINIYVCIFFTLLVTVLFFGLDQTRCMTVEKNFSKKNNVPFSGEVFSTYTQKKNLVKNESSSYVHRKSSRYVHRKSSSHIHRKSSNYVNSKSPSYIHRKSSSYIHRKSSNYVHRKSSKYLH